MVFNIMQSCPYTPRISNGEGTQKSSVCRRCTVFSGFGAAGATSPGGTVTSWLQRLRRRSSARDRKNMGLASLNLLSLYMYLKFRKILRSQCHLIEYIWKFLQNRPCNDLLVEIPGNFRESSAKINSFFSHCHGLAAKSCRKQSANSFLKFE